MNITVVWDADYPWDVRIEKVCRSLVGAGHEVHLVCRNIAQQETEAQIDGINIHRLPAFRLLPRAVNSALSFPAFFSPLWLWKIYQVARRSRSSLMLVRDLPMCPAGLLVAKLLGIPCLLDMAECYPEMLRCTWKFEGFRLRNFFLRNPALADVIERFCIARLANIFVMIEESRERLIAMGTPAHKIAQVSNTPTTEACARYATGRRQSAVPSLVYVGLVNPSRGLDTVVEGARILRDRGVVFHLVVAGTGKQFARIRAMIDEFGLADRVSLLGWVEHKRIGELFAGATLGLVPHHVCSHWNNTIPNKLFDYMAAGIPVVSSDVVPMRRIIEDTRCGIVYRDPDPESFAHAVQTLLEAPERLVEMAENGKRAVRERFNWGVDEATLVKTIGMHA